MDTSNVRYTCYSSVVAKSCQQAHDAACDLFVHNMHEESAKVAASSCTHTTAYMRTGYDPVDVAYIQTYM